MYFSHNTSGIVIVNKQLEEISKIEVEDSSFLLKRDKYLYVSKMNGELEVIIITNQNELEAISKIKVSE